MHPNATQLASRNPALAALVGALPSRGADFGGRSARRAPGFSTRATPAPRRGQATFGYEHGQDRPVFGDDFGADAGGDTSHPLHPQNHGMTLEIVRRHHHREHMTRHRELVLEPNKGSDVKIERYSFPLAQALVLGTPSAFTTLTGTPSVYIRSQRVTTNAPAYGFAYLTGIQTGNVNALVGAVGEDAADYNAGAFDSHLDLPTLAPGIPMVVSGNYTGFVPPGYTGGNPFLFTVSFKGPASMTA
jgi:hypothetical protein